MKTKFILIALGLLVIVAAFWISAYSKNNNHLESVAATSKVEALKPDEAKPYIELVNPSGFVNTADEPITLSQYIGKKVILLEFLTYGCINCQRTFPYLNDWYDKYKDDGLIVIGVHTPEFAYEHLKENVDAAMKKEGIKFPVVLDNDYKTWNAYGNQHWPHRYLIDLEGNIVYDHIGEGDYDVTEALIQKLLGEKKPDETMASNSTDKTATVPVGASEIMKKTALLADGCFWCVEHDLAKVLGVLDVVSGYAGGTTNNPTYEDYSKNGHREVVLVTYDPTRVTYANLVEHIIKHGDPTDGAGSFYDRGFQYAPAIYYDNEEEKQLAEAVIGKVNEANVFPKPLDLVVIPRVPFFAAEDYHQDYAEKNSLKYSFYRSRSGRDAFIKKYWGENADFFTFSKDIVLATKAKELTKNETMTQFNEHSWDNYQKPTDSELKNRLTDIQYKVTQQEGTERPFSNEYDKNYEPGIYVDIVSGEPLYSSKDKFDSGTGWPSFVKPINDMVVTLHEDRKLFSTRTEVRSTHADSHIGHVFDDGPVDRGGKRYCMNSAAMRFISKDKMVEEGYKYLLNLVE